ncbi:hypothetical protein F5146DRAFT_1006888 [Armillaria mellea]|nr:hypothetical protein F5146DRAFT_1006888 [Armillaria mellea]
MWTEEVTVWEEDILLLNPYLYLDETLAQMKHCLEEKEQRSPAPIVHDTSVTACLWLGLQLEDQQQWICIEADSEGVLMPAQAMELQKKHKWLQKNLWLFCKLQMVYILRAALKLLQESVA